MKSYSLHVKHKKNQDSKPIIFESAGLTLLGCFDGLGGSGIYKSRPLGSEDFVPSSYHASRMYGQTVSELVEKQGTKINLESISEALADSMVNIPQKFEEKPPMMKSKLAKRFASTCVILKLQEDGDRLEVESYWSGDSRAYLFDSHFGLVQLTKDDVLDGLDPYQNRTGAPMSCLLYTSPSPRDATLSRMPSSA